MNKLLILTLCFISGCGIVETEPSGTGETGSSEMTSSENSTTSNNEVCDPGVLNCKEGTCQCPSATICCEYAEPPFNCSTEQICCPMNMFCVLIHQ